MSENYFYLQHTFLIHKMQWLFEDEILILTLHWHLQQAAKDQELLSSLQHICKDFVTLSDKQLCSYII